MAEDEKQDEEDLTPFWVMLKQFLDTHQGSIGKVIEGWGRNIEHAERQRWWTTAGTFILLGGIIATISFLALLGIVTGEAVAFLVGAIIGYLFSFIRRFIIPTGG